MLKDLGIIKTPKYQTQEQKESKKIQITLYIRKDSKWTNFNFES